MQKNIEDNENEIDTNDKNHQENMGVYILLWLAIISGFIAQFFIEPQYQFSTTMFGLMWLVGFIVSVYAVFITGQKFRDYNLLFIFMTPFAIIFWLSVFYGLKESNTTQTNNQTIQKGDIIREFQNSDPKDWHKNEKWQQVNQSLKKEYGETLTSLELNALLQEIANEQKRNTPMRIDSHTIFTNVNVHSQTIFFMYEVERPIGYVDTENLKRRMIAEQNFCKTNETLLRYGAAISYVYYNNPDKVRGGDYQLMFLPKDCGY